MGSTTNNEKNKPTLLLVPGAWFSSSIFSTLITAFQELNYNDVVVAPYPSLNPANETAASTADCAKDTAHVREEYLLPLVNAGKDVVVFAHSYGGMPAAGAATGLTKRTMAKGGKAGGVIGLIMASAFAIGDGISCADAMGGDTSPWVLKDNPSKYLSLPAEPAQNFLNDLPPEVADEVLKSAILPCATLSFFSPQPKPVFSEPDIAGLCAYIKLTLDQAIPLAGQEAMMAYSGAKWSMKELEQSHCSGFVILEKAREMVAIVDEFVEGFVKTL